MTPVAIIRDAADERLAIVPVEPASSPRRLALSAALALDALADTLRACRVEVTDRMGKRTARNMLVHDRETAGVALMRLQARLPAGVWRVFAGEQIEAIRAGAEDPGTWAEQWRRWAREAR